MLRAWLRRDCPTRTSPAVSLPHPGRSRPTSPTYIASSASPRECSSPNRPHVRPENPHHPGKPDPHAELPGESGDSAGTGAAAKHAVIDFLDAAGYDASTWTHSVTAGTCNATPPP